MSVITFNECLISLFQPGDEGSEYEYDYGRHK